MLQMALMECAYRCHGVDSLFSEEYMRNMQGSRFKRSEFTPDSHILPYHMSMCRFSHRFISIAAL